MTSQKVNETLLDDDDDDNDDELFAYLQTIQIIKPTAVQSEETPSKSPMVHPSSLVSESLNDIDGNQQVKTNTPEQGEVQTKEQAFESSNKYLIKPMEVSEIQMENGNKGNVDHRIKYCHQKHRKKEVVNSEQGGRTESRKGIDLSLKSLIQGDHQTVVSCMTDSNENNTNIITQSIPDEQNRSSKQSVIEIDDDLNDTDACLVSVVNEVESKTSENVGNAMQNGSDKSCEEETFCTAYKSLDDELTETSRTETDCLWQDNRYYLINERDWKVLLSSIQMKKLKETIKSDNAGCGSEVIKEQLHLKFKDNGDVCEGNSASATPTDLYDTRLKSDVRTNFTGATPVIKHFSDPQKNSTSTESESQEIEVVYVKLEDGELKFDGKSSPVKNAVVSSPYQGSGYTQGQTTQSDVLHCCKDINSECIDLCTKPSALRQSEGHVHNRFTRINNKLTRVYQHNDHSVISQLIPDESANERSVDTKYVTNDHDVEKAFFIDLDDWNESQGSSGSDLKIYPISIQDNSYSFLHEYSQDGLYMAETVDSCETSAVDGMSSSFTIDLTEQIDTNGIQNPPVCQKKVMCSKSPIKLIKFSPSRYNRSQETIKSPNKAEIKKSSANIIRNLWSNFQSANDDSELSRVSCSDNDLGNVVSVKASSNEDVICLDSEDDDDGDVVLVKYLQRNQKNKLDKAMKDQEGSELYSAEVFVDKSVGSSSEMIHRNQNTDTEFTSKQIEIPQNKKVKIGEMPEKVLIIDMSDITQLENIKQGAERQEAKCSDQVESPIKTAVQSVPEEDRTVNAFVSEGNMTLASSKTKSPVYWKRKVSSDSPQEKTVKRLKTTNISTESALGEGSKSVPRVEKISSLKQSNQLANKLRRKSSNSERNSQDTSQSSYVPDKSARKTVKGKKVSNKVSKSKSSVSQSVSKSSSGRSRKCNRNKERSGNEGTAGSIKDERNVKKLKSKAPRKKKGKSKFKVKRTETLRNGNLNLNGNDSHKKSRKKIGRRKASNLGRMDRKECDVIANECMKLPTPKDTVIDCKNVKDGKADFLEKLFLIKLREARESDKVDGETSVNENKIPDKEIDPHDSAEHHDINSKNSVSAQEKEDYSVANNVFHHKVNSSHTIDEVNVNEREFNSANKCEKKGSVSLKSDEADLLSVGRNISFEVSVEEDRSGNKRPLGNLRHNERSDNNSEDKDRLKDNTGVTAKPGAKITANMKSKKKHDEKKRRSSKSIKEIEHKSSRPSYKRQSDKWKEHLQDEAFKFDFNQDFRKHYRPLNVRKMIRKILKPKSDSIAKKSNRDRKHKSKVVSISHRSRTAGNMSRFRASSESEDTWFSDSGLSGSFPAFKFAGKD